MALAVGSVILKLLSGDFPGEILPGDLCHAKPARPPLSFSTGEVEFEGCNEVLVISRIEKTSVLIPNVLIIIMLKNRLPGIEQLMA